MRTRDEIEAFLNRELADGADSSYEEGIQDALDWVTGAREDPPLP